MSCLVEIRSKLLTYLYMNSITMVYLGECECSLPVNLSIINGGCIMYISHGKV